MEKIYAINFGTISAGGSSEKAWAPDRDIVVHSIFFVERNDKSLSNVLADVKLSGDPVTFNEVPAAAFGQDVRESLKVEKTLSRGAEIRVTVKNQRSDSVTVDMIIRYEPR